MKMKLLTIMLLLVIGQKLDAQTSKQQVKADKSNWKKAQSENTLEAYSIYLHGAPNSPYSTEAKEHLKLLFNADMTMNKEIGVEINYHLTDSIGKVLLSDGIKDLIVAALVKQGYKIVEDNYQKKVIISVFQNKYLCGTSNSYWHYTSDMSMKIVFSKSYTGPIFTNQYNGPGKTSNEIYSFPSIGFIPVDETMQTFISPDTGGVWGAGVKFTQPNTDPSVIATDKSAFQDFKWSTTVDRKAVLDSIRSTLGQFPPLGIYDTTEWQ